AVPRPTNNALPARTRNAASSAIPCPRILSIERLLSASTQCRSRLFPTVHGLAMRRLGRELEQLHTDAGRGSYVRQDSLGAAGADFRNVCSPLLEHRRGVGHVVHDHAKMADAE